MLAWTPITVVILMGNPAAHGATQLTVKQDGKHVASLLAKVKNCVISSSVLLLLLKKKLTIVHDSNLSKVRKPTYLKILSTPFSEPVSEPVPEPVPEPCCTTSDCADYRGTKATTSSGKTCQAWDSQTPHSHTRTTAKWEHMLACFEKIWAFIILILKSQKVWFVAESNGMGDHVNGVIKCLKQK